MSTDTDSYDWRAAAIARGVKPMRVWMSMLPTMRKAAPWELDQLANNPDTRPVVDAAIDDLAGR